MHTEPDACGRPRGDSDHGLEIVVSDLAGSRRTATSISPNARQTRSRRFAPGGRRLRRQAVIAGAVLVALVVIGFPFYGSQIRGLFFPPPPPPLQLRPQLAGMQCLQDAAWSPNSAQIALLGRQYDSNCADDSLFHAGLITIFDANDGTQRATINPDDLIIPTVETVMQIHSASFAISVALVYEHILWSPDGKRLAVTFWVDTSLIDAPQLTPDGAPAILDGMLLVNSNGTSPRVLTGLASAYSPADARWDLTAGTLVATPGFGYDFRGFGMLTPALAYRWQADGTLAPIGSSLTTDSAPIAPPLGPVGMPDGASTFSVWQPGVVTAATQTSPGTEDKLLGVYLWQGDQLAAWSPDGRYLFVGGAAAGLLVRPGTAQPSLLTVNTFGLDSPWRLPLRDAGLAAILRVVDPNSQQGLAVAWRPDGREVAAYTHRAADGSTSNTLPVTVYDCATGHVLATLRPATAQNGALVGQGALLRWSPDGTHLLLFDDLVGAPLVWGPRQLG